MCTNKPPHVTDTGFRWLRDIHLYEHTIAVDRDKPDGNENSSGHFLDSAYVTEDGEYIGDKPEVKALAAVWYGANQFHRERGNFEIQTEQTCNVIAVLEGVQRHDVVLDEHTWSIVDNMQPHSREGETLNFAIMELKTTLERLQRNAENIRGVFRAKHKDKIEGRLDRLIAEQEAMLASYREIKKELGLPQTAYEVRQYVLSQLIIHVDQALGVVTPMRRKVKDMPLPHGMLERICDSEAALFRGRAQLKKWRDNPSQKFGRKMKDTATLLIKTNQDISLLKDDSYIAISKLGARFYTRCGRAPNPYRKYS